MPLDFSSYPLKSNGFASQPFSFLPGAVSTDLARLTEIDLIENGTPIARALWQSKQIVNLFEHARKTSQFWRSRLPKAMMNATILPQLPILSRSELSRQIEEEGALISYPNGQQPLRGHMTSGSTSRPVCIYTTPQSGYYNSLRSVYEYFRNGWPVDCNRTHMAPLGYYGLIDRDMKIKVDRHDGWLGALSMLFQNGQSKKIFFNAMIDEVVTEFESASLGYVIGGIWQMRRLLSHFSPEQLKERGMVAWIQFGGSINDDLRGALHNVGIKSHSNYSCEEAGPLAYECVTCPGHFHVAHSNVLVEEDTSLTAQWNGKTLSRVLITHLHSYATPIIRYDVGDFATFHKQCPCGHQGTTLSDIYGRGKHFVKHRDGRLSEFHITARAGSTICNFKEWRIRQTSYSDLELELSGISTLTADQHEQFVWLVKSAVGPEFHLTIKCVEDIDWSDNPKRLFFVSRIDDKQDV